MSALRLIALGLISLCGVSCSQLGLQDLALKTEFNPLNYGADSPRVNESHETERIAVVRFVNAMKLERLDAVRLTCSKRFQEAALKRADSLNDFTQLGIPVGDVEVVNVENISPSEKMVNVAIGEMKQKMTARLTLDQTQNEWLIDDLFMKQKRDGVVAVRSVTDQMHLMSSFRTFMEAVQDGGREQLLAHVTPSFRQSLSTIPDSIFERIRRQVAGKENLNKLKPEAQLDDDFAVIKVHRLSGQLMLSLALENGLWLVDDLAVESREDQEQIPSLRKTASAVEVGVRFLKAFHASDQKSLEALCIPTFYKNAIAGSDLSAFPLPIEALESTDFRIKAQGRLAWITIPHRSDTITIDLVRSNEVDPDVEQPDLDESYRVREVTLYSGKQQQQLSSVFVSQAIMRVYARALAEKNLPMLKRLSTPDFSTKVWDRVDETSVHHLPLDGLVGANLRIVSTNYLGQLTQLRVQSSAGQIVFQIREWNDEQLIDDITLSIPDRPASLKDTLAVVVPMQSFLIGLQSNDIQKIHASLTDEFRRTAWRHIDQVPAAGMSALEACRQPLGKIELHDKHAVLHLAGALSQTKVQLKRENEQWAVDDVEVTRLGPAPQTASLKQTMKNQLADGTIRTTPVNSMVQSASPSTFNRGIQQIGYQTNDANDGRAANADLQTGSAVQPLSLDQLPVLEVPLPKTQSSEQASVPEVIPAHGGLPHEQPKKRYNALAPIWNQ